MQIKHVIIKRTVENRKWVKDWNSLEIGRRVGRGIGIGIGIEVGILWYLFFFRLPPLLLHVNGSAYCNLPTLHSIDVKGTRLKPLLSLAAAAAATTTEVNLKCKVVVADNIPFLVLHVLRSFSNRKWKKKHVLAYG